MYIDIQNLVNDDTNLIEIYIGNNFKKTDNNIDINVSYDIVNKLYNKFKKTKENINNVFYKNNLAYIYDKSNDSQVVIIRTVYKESFLFNNKAKLINNYYILTLKEDKLPPHYFPCVNDIDYITEYKINEIRINNRISIIIKEEKDNIYIIYIQYRHNTNVDLDKIQDTLNNIIKTIEQIY